MTYPQYLEKVYPYKDSVWKREGKGPVWKIGKFLGLRIAYFLHLIHFSANVLDILGFVISLTSLTLLLRGPDRPVSWVMGILFFYIHPFIDFIDGSLARAGDHASRIGAVLDNVGPDVSRVLIVVFLAWQTGSNLLIILATLAAYLLVVFVKKTWDDLPAPGGHLWIKRIFCHPMCPISGRVMLGLLPTTMGFLIIQPNLLRPFALWVTTFYIFLALCWLLLCTFSRWDQRAAS